MARKPFGRTALKAEMLARVPLVTVPMAAALAGSRIRRKTSANEREEVGWVVVAGGLLHFTYFSPLPSDSFERVFGLLLRSRHNHLTYVISREIWDDHC